MLLKILKFGPFWVPSGYEPNFFFRVYVHSIKTNVDAKFHEPNLSILHAKVPKKPQKCPKMPFLAVFPAANFFPAKISKFFS